MVTFPCLVDFFKVRIRFLYKIHVWMDFIELEESLRGRKTVSAGIALFPAPIRGIIFQIGRILQPTTLVEMMGGRTANGIVLPSPRHIRKELSDNEAFRGRFHMLAESPPPEKPCLLQFLVRALEDRNILFQELFRLIIRELLDVNLLISGIELGHIFRDQRSAIFVNLLNKISVTARGN